jgi:hypothetical protein
MRKMGANFIDVNRILDGFNKGMTASQISDTLGVPLECVKSYEPVKAPKSETTDKSVKF